MNIFEEFPRILGEIEEKDLKYALVRGKVTKMNKIDKVFKELSSLYELNKIIRTYKIR
ncbi:MAG: hypothetical protein MUP98_20335 [Candidatus Aminicenantes bacterium]|nr:hypothetical protein [Candidatus Aminicenantes bacterium]